MRELIRRFTKGKETGLEKEHKASVANFDFAVRLTDAYSGRQVAEQLVEALASMTAVPVDQRQAYAEAMRITNERAASVGLQLQIRQGYENLDHDFRDWSGSEGRFVTMQAIPSKLADFFRGLTKLDIASPTTAEHIKRVTNYLTESVVNGKLTFQEVRPIADALDQLGRTDAAVLLGQVLDHAEIGAVREYMQLHDSGSLEGPDSKHFGPAQWHTDSNANYYDGYWSKATRAVTAALKNVNAVSLAGVAADNLLKCAQLAQAKMRTEQNAEKRKRYAELLPVLESQLPALTKLVETTDEALDKLHRGE